MSEYWENREDEIFVRQRHLIDLCGLSKPMVFDVGANVGQSIKRYRGAFPNCTLHSFEPIPGLFDDLRAQWQDIDGIHLHPVALAAERGDVEFHVTRLQEASSLLKPDPLVMSLSQDGKYEYRTISVPCETLDHFCSSHAVDSIDILKIDVQGAELQVLNGASALLREQRIGQVYMEINLAEGYLEQAALPEVLSFFEACSYRLWDILPFVYTSAGQAWTANALFVSPRVYTQATQRPAK